MLKKKYNKIIIYIMISVLSVVTIASFLLWYYSESVLMKYQYNIVTNCQENSIKIAKNMENRYLRAAMQIANDKTISRIFYKHGSMINEQNEVISDISQRISEYMFYYDFQSVDIINTKKDFHWSSDDYRVDKFSLSSENGKINELIALYNKGRNFINSSEIKEKSKGIYFLSKNFQDYYFIIKINEAEYRKNVLQYLSLFESDNWMYYNDMPYITDSQEITNVLDEYKIEYDVTNNHIKINNMYFVMKKAGNYLMVTMIPEFEFRKDIFKNIFLLIIIAAIIILFCIVILLINTKKYVLLGKAYDTKIDDMQKKLRLETWNNIIYKMFAGVELTEKENNDFEEMKKISQGKKCLPMLIFLDDTDITENFQSKKNEVISHIEKEFNNEFMSFILNLEKDRIGAVVFFEDTSDEYIIKHLTLAHEKLTDDLENNISIVTNINISGDLEKDIMLLFITAQYRFVDGYSDIIIGERLKKQKLDAGYPIDIQHDIISAILENNQSMYINECNKFRKYIKDNNFSKGAIWGLDLYINVMNVFFKRKFDEKDIKKLKFKNIDEIFNRIEEECLSKEKFMDDIEKFENSVLDMIEECYSDSDFGILDIAARLNINSVYAGQKFRKIFDKTFNTYLAEFRCNKAIELLINTNKKSIEISALCGFKSNTYYNYIFKKYKNVTPQQYRKMYQVSEKNDENKAE